MRPTNDAHPGEALPAPCRKPARAPSCRARPRGEPSGVSHDAPSPARTPALRADEELLGSLRLWVVLVRAQRAIATLLGRLELGATAPE